MRLINTRTLTLQEFYGTSIPPYAILSHTWEEEEVTFSQFTTLPQTELASKKGYAKIKHTCRLARKSDIDWAWVDTCCIDKSSSAELTEAINSMFRWYAEARVCYAFLSDLEGGGKGEGGKKEGAKEVREDGKKEETKKKCEVKEDGKKGVKKEGMKKEEVKKVESGKGGAEKGEHASLAQKVAKFADCRWFTRGWTLQELIAPQRLGFYNQDWEFQGEKKELSAVLSEITRISTDVLNDAGLLQTIPVAQRMSWAAKRQTTRAEDLAYCLLGIFNVNMPLLYGEGDKAFIRLQEEIIKESNDLTLFAWRLDPHKASSQLHWGILAPSLDVFADCADIKLWVDPMHNNECAMTSKGLRVTPVPGGGLRLGTNGTYVMNLQCHRRDRPENLGIFLQQHGCDVYTRVRPDSFSRAPRSEGDKYRLFYVLKAVSAARAVVLSTSHRRAIDLSRALETLKGKGFRLAGAGAFEPEGHWDAQRGLFLTRGLRNFVCRVRLELDRAGVEEPRLMVMECHLGEEEDGVTVKLQVGDGQRNLRTQDVGQGQWTLARWTPSQWLRAGAVQEFVKGQPVYFVVVDKL